MTVIHSPDEDRRWYRIECNLCSVAFVGASDYRDAFVCLGNVGLHADAHLCRECISRIDAARNGQVRR
jgi:hypothetical protein